MDPKLQEVVDFVLKNKRWPNQNSKGLESRLYGRIKANIKKDGWLAQQIMPFKFGIYNSERVGDKLLGRVKGTKTGINDGTIELGLFLMDSGGCGW